MCLRVVLGIQLPLLQLRNTYYPVSVPFLWGKEKDTGEKEWKKNTGQDEVDMEPLDLYLEDLYFYIIWNRCTRLLPPASLPVVWLTKVFLIVKACVLHPEFLSALMKPVSSPLPDLFFALSFFKRKRIRYYIEKIFMVSLHFETFDCETRELDFDQLYQFLAAKLSVFYMKA